MMRSPGIHSAGVEIVEVVHEALIQNWERLRKWMDEDREFRTWQERLRAAHREARMGLIRWLRHSRPQNVLSAPVIYAMIVPLAFLDLCMTVYQRLCFPLYRVGRVRRGDYVTGKQTPAGPC